MADIPPELIWVLLVAVIVQGFSMALLVYLMFLRERKKPEEKKARPKQEEDQEEET